MSRSLLGSIVQFELQVYKNTQQIAKIEYPRVKNYDLLAFRKTVKINYLMQVFFVWPYQTLR